MREIRNAEAFMRARGSTLRAAPAEAVADYVATKPRTWSSYKLVRSALGHYWAITGRSRPPLWAVPTLRKPTYQCRALDEAPASRLEAAARARGDEKGLVVLLGLYLGLRREEIASLRWDCFDRDWVTILGKGGRTRTLFVHPVLLEAVVAYPGRSAEWVFPGRMSGHANPATIWNWTKAVAAAAGITAAPHELRHTCLATAHDATGDLRATQTLAGHARPETTALYTRTTRKRLVALVMSIDYGAVESSRCQEASR